MSLKLSISEALDRSGLFEFSRLLLKRRRSLAILLHGTYPSVFPEIPKALHSGMAVEDLDLLLQWLNRKKIDVISLEEYLSGRPGLLITFDDAYANNFNYALPLLEKYGCPATFFVATGHINEGAGRRWLENFSEAIAANEIEVAPEVGYELFYGMTPAQLLELSRHSLIDIGGHTHSHPWLPDCDRNQIKVEVSMCSDFIESLTSKRPDVFAYPYGGYDERCFDVLHEASYRAAFAVQPSLRINRKFEIPRIGIYRSDPSYLSVKMSFLFRNL